MSSLKPNLDSIDQFKFYNLYGRDWKIDASEASTKFNKPILEEIADDFSEYTGIEYKSIMRIFGKYILGKSGEDELLLYTSKGSKNVYYYFTYCFSDIYKTLNPEE